MERENLSAMRDSSLAMITSSPEHYRQYLDLQADNIHCSVGNVALTMAQLQGATKIGTTSYWHSLGRYVRDDAINAGAAVFVPPRKKEYRGYFMGSYYDVSQTTGKPLPEPVPLEGKGPRMEAALAALMDQSPVTVQYRHSTQGSHSRSSEMRVRTPAPWGGCHQCWTSPSSNCREAASSSCSRVRSGQV